MSKHRRAAKIDDSQADIVKALKIIPGVSVSLNHDDILVGYKNKNYWYEIKTEEGLLKKDGTFRKGKVKDSQYDILENWKGHYKIVWTLSMILEDLKIS